MERAQGSRARFGTVDVAFRAHDRDRRAAGGLLAGALAFRVFLVLLPMVLIMVGGLGLSTGDDDVAVRADQVGLTAYVSDLIRSAEEATATSNVVAVVVGLVGLFFGCRALVKALRIAFALAWALGPPRGSVRLKATLVAMGAVAGLWGSSILLGIVRGEALGLLAGALVGLAYNGGLMLGLQLVMPHAEGATWKNFVPGAAIAAVGMLGIHLFTELYLLGKAASFSVLYGGLGVAAVLLLWLYFISRLVVASAVINATTWHRHHPTPA